MTPVIIIDLIGLDGFIQAYGFQLFFIGIGRVIGPPLIGKFKETVTLRVMISIIAFQEPCMMQVEIITMDFTLLVVPC